MKQRMKLRSLSLLLVLLFLLASFVGCNTPSSTPAESTSAGADSTTAEEITTEAETEPTYRDLFENGTTQYKLICPEDPSDYTFNLLIELQSAIKELTGVELEFSTDFYNPFQETLPETAFEILIGDTNRAETKEAKALLREKDYAVYEHNGRIALVGGTEAKTAEAVEYFIENYFNLETSNITVKEGECYINRHQYDLGFIKIEGVDLMNYSVVIPEKPETMFPYFAALNLVDYLNTEAGIQLPIVFDTDATSNYEIVIGETTRDESRSAMQTQMTDNQYILKMVGSSVYMYGKDYMVGGAVSDFVNNYLEGSGDDGELNVTGLPTSNLTKTFSFPKKANSALILIGDGMGQNHVESTFRSRSDQFLATYLENVGICTTFQYGNNEFSTSYTDSAASATALATGYKTKNGYLGLDHNKASIQNVRELASALGAATAVLTSDVITGATPAGFLCHHTSRKDTSTLQKQVNSVLRNDDNLLFAVSVNDNRNKLLSETQKILYTIADEGKDDTFFAMIEEAHIDKESHKNNLANAQSCVLRYNDIIGYCIQFVMLHPETVLVITADHECGGLTIDGGNFGYTSGNHTNAKVPVYALGPGTEIFKDTKVDNTDIGKFLASVYTSAPFGDPSLG